MRPSGVRRFMSGVKGSPEGVRDLFSWHHRTVNIGDKAPHISNTAYVAPSATLAGRVEVWDYSSVLNEAVVRGDVRLVRIGAYTTVGEGSVVTEAAGPLSDVHDGSCIVGHYVSVGANCTLHATTIEPECDIGSGSVLAEGSYMEQQSCLEPGSCLPAHARVPSGQVWGGNPAVKVRDLSQAEREAIRGRAEAAYALSRKHKDEIEATPYNMDAVWEAERLGYGKVIGYHMKN